MPNRSGPGYSDGSFSLSFPCIYPVCPLSIDHARMYVVGDIFARYFRSCHKKVIFPIGFHFSGSTAQKFCNELNSTESNDTKDLFTKIYNCSSQEINYFKKSGLNILNFYTYKTLSELKKINITADYNEYYTTISEQYESFVHAIFDEYKKKGVLIHKNNNLQLEYTNKKWKESVISWIDQISTILPDKKKNLSGAINDLENGWDILKNEGIGVKLEEDKIIDSMHDSELLSLYDLINHVSLTEGEFTLDEIKELFLALSGNFSNNLSPKVSSVISLLPTSLLIMEEHLKVWFIKKIYVETLLFNKEYRTREFCVHGLGMRDNKRMSSSKGNAILLKDLILKNDPIKARMIMIMTSSNISNFYNYNNSIITEVDKVLSKFKNFISSTLIELSSDSKFKLSDFLNEDYRENIFSKIEKNEELVLIFCRLEKYLKEGFLKQGIIELMRTIPKKYKNHSAKEKLQLMPVINYYIKILLGVTIIDL